MRGKKNFFMDSSANLDKNQGSERSFVRLQCHGSKQKTCHRNNHEIILVSHLTIHKYILQES